MQTFLHAADAWICEGYSIDIRYLADIRDDGAQILDASIALNPLPPKNDLSFQIESSTFAVGQIQRLAQSKKSLIRLLTLATTGKLELPSRVLSLLYGEAYEFRSEMSHRERWFSELHLLVMGSLRPAPSTTVLANIDNLLRGSQPPFDGLSDAARWLGLSAPGISSYPRSIAIRVGPPVDMIFDECALSDDHLTLTLHAHPKFDVNHVGLAVRAAPGIGLQARKQVAREIKWGRVRSGRREGVAQIQIENADSVLAMLMIGTETVRRQWFLDPTKARNNRLLAVQHFDKDLRMIRQAVLESSDPTKFEQGVAALLFLLGFSPSVQLETDSPDLIVTTPGGKLVIVECTTRTSDFASKVGKLVDRRGALSKSLAASGHPAQVISVLICRLPRDQIAVHADALRGHNTILLAGEDLAAGFGNVRFPTDPDRMLDAAQARVSGEAASGYND